MAHTPVLLKEAIEYLNIGKNSNIIDATLDGGGHTRAILEKYPEVKILGIEFDPTLFKSLQLNDDRLIKINDSYVNLKNIVKDYKFKPDGILFDLGLSSWHYEESGRGFSFKRNEILDMRFNPEIQPESAVDIVNKYSEDELRELISYLGEEQFAGNIAKNIVRARREKPIIMTEDLVNVISRSVPEWYKQQKINFATKTFQALRVKVNDELGNVRKGVQAAIEVLKPGGRLAVISFQGLEDKTVKEVFKENVKAGAIKLAVKGTIRPSWEEQRTNPRSRSAKMKVAQKV
ncbi:MAG: 16S rRNA (cytosine(1402)-N(4))-methyltransferase [Candidatus Yanofskybacteria bacterium RIFCSPLOWO2_12_FULL_43_11b]|uniref:Ribosomal RNA small subunit methyltransferase H n=1 Tax=Candidatus Yanofskybacteria bacterium RIFCSPLOWO2_12_FULL_43_11b TaxID=1802710 RepID=A0A1F8H8Y3_9BACT|nr:MAG: 16S rRNA (cytosine(1402)-N(4))-methyltransferase [Candidatus Yanofskybacteria bacterium RIFCSPHIGHO2_01_FULL_43_32]OGN12006.1 MAG: 16S rRNA (cytosine(1402)-N(4))-methyltransferase [Candidatus Yanofskybacteria bacterium RIFCSPHIGHO2_02_FULL_43_12]OGN17834.1 MAG: 16S rRNA (cytosine(1402)-N(4))-methyltransferase [Candidatus Yanofskybacteria bacterium RIFCSPHIGHO2_12_FULL_43_11]OGN24792.1 MAG: 16S rRNA (cytosine(1402)-N(4))-methyltransferase [Candidatus Yanofskybacteria bacterium RIFCSPLOWO2